MTNASFATETGTVSAARAARKSDDIEDDGFITVIPVDSDPPKGAREDDFDPASIREATITLNGKPAFAQIDAFDRAVAMHGTAWHAHGIFCAAMHGVTGVSHTRADLSRNWQRAAAAALGAIEELQGI